MMVSNGKYYCKTCGWAAKTACPIQGHESVAMGTVWRPGRKGSKTRLWDDRVWGRRADARRQWRQWRYRGYGPPRTAPDLVVKLGGRDRLRAQTGAGWMRMGDPVTEAIRDRALKGKTLAPDNRAGKRRR